MTITPLSKAYIRITTLIILLLWLIAYAALLYIVFNFSWQIAVTDSLVTYGLLAVACVVISNMLSYYQPKDNKTLYIVLVSLALSLLITYLSQLILSYLFASDVVYLVFLNLADIINFAISLLCISWCAIASVLWYKVEEQSEISQRMLATQSMAKEAELNKLRHQLQPHFLFNSLNSVYSLTITNPKEAGNMIMKLSAFLRGTLKRDDEIWVSVVDEMEYIQLYLDIEKIRFGHRLNIDVLVEDEANKLSLPGTLMQPIVENAIKFGLYNTSSAITISIEVKKVNDALRIEVRNPYDSEMKSSKGTGFGLSAIRRRLYLLFADNNLLQTQTQNDNLYITSLKIPQTYD